MLLGPTEHGGAPGVGEIEVRRYRCQRCRAVVVVCPRAVRPRYRYGAVGIALALALWTEGVSAREVRERISPFRFVGDDARRGWRSLRRWAGAARALWPRLVRWPHGPPRQLALELVRRLASLAPIPSGVMTVDACAGAAIA